MVVLMKKIILITLCCSALLSVTAGCNRNALTGSKLTLANYQQIAPGMTKAQVERIMGPPTTLETKDMLIFKKTTYRYEDGTKFALFTFKNEELDSKESNLAAQ
jgi:outer membrane protein assembly factor BamE (lipoprotein component of BamABCDE complex)